MNFKLNKIVSILLVIVGIALKLEARRPSLYDPQTGLYAPTTRVTPTRTTPVSSTQNISGRPFINRPGRWNQPRTLGEMYAQQAAARKFGYGRFNRGPGWMPSGISSGAGIWKPSANRRNGVICKDGRCRLGKPGSRPVKVTGQVNPVTGKNRAIACRGGVCRKANVKRVAPAAGRRGQFPRRFGATA